MSTDYVPKPDDAFLAWVNNLYLYIVAHYEAWQIPDPRPLFAHLLANYAEAYEAAHNPNRGKVDVLYKNETRAILETALRSYVKAYLAFNPAVVDTDRVAMNITVHDRKPTPIPAPTTFPEAETDSSMIRQLKVKFRDSGSGRRAKPAGVHGVEIRWELLSKQPISVDELKNSAFDTKSPHTFIFDESQRGKSLYLCLRWENAKGEKGPWSEIISAIIP
ncbi:MAG: hypothetical protein LBQ77_07230 [Treponema sp.]|nr:hypothetical protein [Treponema sp.]